VDLVAIEESILAHLQRMLNSRQGCSLSAPDYGTPDVRVAARDRAEAINQMEASIRRSIEKYEPRLADVSVRFVKSDDEMLVLCFEVSARLKTKEVDANVRFTTRMVPEGRVDVKG
jgi:type VI secretion system protein